MLRILIVVVAAGWLSGCSGSSFLGRKFDDFTAHYNKFYNANRTFREQERKLQKGDKKIDTDSYLAIFELPEQRGRSTEFEKVITKCADLLRNHPRSKWVDDALLLIGKSYFYQSNFVGAEQKFKEIINLSGPLKDEAEFWLSRTLVAGQSTAAAEDIIGTSLADEELGKEWRSRFLLLRGDLRTEVGDWQAAIDDIKAGLQHVDDGDTAARALFLLGQLYETTEQFEEAVDAYHRVQNKKPLYELSYAAMVNEIRVEGLQIDPQDALRKLDRMMRDNKHFQNRDNLRYLQARILAADGEPLLARDSFFEQLYPSDPTKKTSLRGEVHYRLAELYRDYLGDFYKAGVHFDTAASVLRTPPAQNQIYAPDAILDAKGTANTFREYRETADELVRMDSLLYLGSLDSVAFDSAVAAVRIQLAAEAERIRQELERRQTQSRFRQSAGESATRTPSATQAASAGSSTAFGFLNYKNLQRVQEAFLNFKEVWGDRPLVPGWRREEAVALAQREALQAADSDKESNGEQGIEQVRFLPPVDISEVPRDSASQEKMRTDRAEARYRLGNVLFLSIGLPDSAAKWYRRVLDEDPDEAVARRALYAMAEVHDALGDAEASRRTLEQVIERYPDSDYAVKARSKLGLPPLAGAVASDSLELASERYDQAYKLWKDGEFQQAIDAMVRNAADYPNLDIAAKSLLAAGRVYLEKAHLDGSDFYGVIPVGDSLFSAEEIAAAAAASADTATATPATSNGDEANRSAKPAPVDAPTGAAASKITEAGENENVRGDVQGPMSRLTSKVIRDEAPDAKEQGGALKIVDDGPAKEEDRGEAQSIPEPGLPPAEAVNEPVADTALTAVMEPAAVTKAGRAEPEPAAAGDNKEPGDSLATPGAKPDSAQTAPAPIKKPELTWTEPEYFVSGLIPVPMTLHSLYETVAAHFGKTPYGERAKALRQGLEAARTEVAVARAAAATEDHVEIAEPAEAVESMGADPDVDVAETADALPEPLRSDSAQSQQPGALPKSRLPGEP